MEKHLSEYCSLHFLAIRIFASEGDSMRLKEIRTRLNDKDERSLRVSLIDGILASMKGELRDALEHFEHVINFSV